MASSDGCICSYSELELAVATSELIISDRGSYGGKLVNISWRHLWRRVARGLASSPDQ